MSIRLSYFTLAGASIVASASVFLSGALVFGVILRELQLSLFFSVFLSLLVASPLILIALKFFRKAKAEVYTQQDSGDGRCSDNSELQYATE